MENYINIDDNHFFRQATLHICSSLNIEIAMQRCIGFLQKVMPAHWLGINLFEPGLSAMRTLAGATPEEAFKLDLVTPLPADALFNLESKDHMDTKLVNDPTTDPVSGTMTRFFGQPDSSLLITHLIIEEERLGALVLQARGRGQFTARHAKLFHMLREPFAVALSNALKHQEVLKLKDMLFEHNKYLQQELYTLSGDEIIGADFGLKQVMEMVHKVAAKGSPVLILGETGVGKEIIANAIHLLSQRREYPFIKVNCGAIPDTLIDSELFGHEKGAFTGAISQKRGRFERAHQGTIFLDEIGELPLHAQIRLLRVLQHQEIERVGGSQTIPVDIRVLAATHRGLKDMIDSRTFREDLFFRLNVFPIFIPPLRERVQDIPALVHHFIKRKSKKMLIDPLPRLEQGAMDLLMSYQWPGNVRELENVIERELILYHGKPLTFDHLLSNQTELPVQNRIWPDTDVISPTRTLDDVIRHHIQNTLEITNGKVHGKDGAARLLGMNPSTLRHKMNKLDIAYSRKYNIDQ